jgi:hypothetical protein
MRQLLATLLFAASSASFAGSLERVDQVDLIELEPVTMRALLVVNLDEDRVNTRQAMKLLFKKVNNYLDFADSGQLLQAAPNASKMHRPKIVVYGPKEGTTGEMQNLAGLKLAGQKAGVEVEVKPYHSGVKSRPIDIKPKVRGSVA